MGDTMLKCDQPKCPYITFSPKSLKLHLKKKHDIGDPEEERK